jgi:probable HAF family extracellular repeat protein
MRAKLLGVATAFALSGVTFPAFAGSFLYTDGVYSTLSIPGVPDPGANSANGINDRGQIVGSVSDPLLNSSTGSNSSTGFVYSGGVATILNIPGATGEAGAFGINNAGQIVGVSIDAATGNKNSFVYSGGVYAPFSVPGHSGDTEATGINDRGQIVGGIIINSPIGSIPSGFQRWSRLSEQIFRVDKWSLCRG